MVEEVKSPENLSKRGETYYYRARVPDDLRVHFGKREFIHSLKTRDRQTALERHARKHLEVTQLISEARRMGRAVPSVTDGSDLSQDDCNRLAALWVADFLADDLRWFRTGTTSTEHLALMDRGNDEFESALAEGLASVDDSFDPSSVKAPVAQTLARYGVEVPEASPSYARRAR